MRSMRIAKNLSAGKALNRNAFLSRHSLAFTITERAVQIVTASWKWDFEIDPPNRPFGFVFNRTEAPEGAPLRLPHLGS